MDDLKKMLGEDYPRTVTVLGKCLPLDQERRFTRYYYSEEEKCGAEVSKFQDGSASITFDELKGQWDGWSERDRRDFVSACNALYRQADFPDILRFLMSQSDPEVWSGIALQVGGCLPRDEAFDLLVGALQRIERKSSETSSINFGVIRDCGTTTAS